MIFFSLGPIETTFRKYTFHKNRFFYPHRAKNGQKMAKNDQKNFGPKILVFCYRDLALTVPVVLAPSEAFFDSYVARCKAENDQMCFPCFTYFCVFYISGPVFYLACVLRVFVFFPPGSLSLIVDFTLLPLCP